jgi:hypothetical protein
MGGRCTGRRESRWPSQWELKRRSKRCLRLPQAGRFECEKLRERDKIMVGSVEQCGRTEEISAELIARRKANMLRSATQLDSEHVQHVVALKRRVHAQDEDWMFPNRIKKGGAKLKPGPIWHEHILARHIQPVADRLGLPHITWRLLRHWERLSWPTMGCMSMCFSRDWGTRVPRRR